MESLPPVYSSDLTDGIRRDAEAVGRVLVVLDDDPTGTQTVHSVPVLAEWSVDILAKEVCTRMLAPACFIFCVNCGIFEAQARCCSEKLSSKYVILELSLLV